MRGSRKSTSSGRNLSGSSGSSGGSSSRKEKVMSGSNGSGGGGGGGTSSSGGGRGGSDGGGVIRRSSVLAKVDDADELVDGWPKWLTDNVPKDALDGLVPKSADAYDKLDKVITLSAFCLNS